MARGAGETLFIGRCAERDYGGPLRAHFGADVEKALDRIEAGPAPVGELSIAATPSTEPTILAAGITPDSILDTMTRIVLAVRFPESWAGQLVCDCSLATKVAAGWNDAVGLEFDTTREPARIGAFLPPTGRVEFWLLGNDADPRSPIKKVASLDAGSLVRLADAKPARERGTVTVTIGSPSQGVAEAIEVGTEIVVTVQ